MKKEKIFSEKYQDTFTVSVELPKPMAPIGKAEPAQPIPLEQLKKIFISPHFYDLIGYGLARCFKKDGTTEFPQDYLFKEGDEYVVTLAEIPNNNEKHVSEVSKIDFTHPDDEVTVISYVKKIEPAKEPDGLETSIYHSKVTMCYHSNRFSKEPPTLSMTIEINPPNSMVVTLLKIMYNQMARRIKSLLSNYEACSNEFIIAGNIGIEKTHKADFYGLQHGIGGIVRVACDKEKLFKSFQCHQFIEQMLPNVKEHKNLGKQTNMPLEKKESFFTTLGNMRFSKSEGVESYEEEVTFTVQKCEKDTIELLSQSGVNFFSQYGIKIELESISSTITAIKFNCYHSLDKKTTAYDYAHWFFSKFSKTVEQNFDIKPILSMRLRNLLDAIVRHTCRYLTDNFETIEITPVKAKELKADTEEVSTKMSTLSF